MLAPTFYEVRKYIDADVCRAIGEDVETLRKCGVPFSKNNDLVIDASGARTIDGPVVISGTINLPDGVQMWFDARGR